MRHWALVTVMSIVFLDAYSVNAKPWRGIVPLRSTRAEVDSFLFTPGLSPVLGKRHL